MTLQVTDLVGGVASFARAVEVDDEGVFLRGVEAHGGGEVVLDGVVDECLHGGAPFLKIFNHILIHFCIGCFVISSTI